MVSVQHANDEVRTLQDLKAISEICDRDGVLLHANSAISFPLVDLPKVNIDLITLTAHKIHGPKGIDALFVKEGVKIERLIDGGYNEFELRAGTKNVPMAMGRKHEESHGSIRYSLSRFNTHEEVEYVAQATGEIVTELRKISPLWRGVGMPLPYSEKVL